MRLTLSASETGHLVFATIHPATCAEVLQRMISAFPAAIQSSVSAQLADCLSAVVYQLELGIRPPQCEVLRPTAAVKNFLRRGDLQQIASAIEADAESGMWTFARYRNRKASRTSWCLPTNGNSAPPPDASTEQPG